MPKECCSTVTEDERQRAIFRSRRMAETDRISDLLTAEYNGKIEGMTKILELWEKGVPINDAKRMLLNNN